MPAQESGDAQLLSELLVRELNIWVLPSGGPWCWLPSWANGEEAQLAGSTSLCAELAHAHASPHTTPCTTRNTEVGIAGIKLPMSITELI